LSSSLATHISRASRLICCSLHFQTGANITTSQPYKHWPKIFNNDSTLTSAVLAGSRATLKR
jgi:hypothetical protein